MFGPSVPSLHSGAVAIERAELRCLQFLIVLASCLPPEGKCREGLDLALALNATAPLSRLAPPADLETNEGVLAWLDTLWSREDLSADERDLVWWQNDGPSMDAAIRELKAIQDRMGRAWVVAPEGFAAPAPAPAPAG